MSHSGELPAAVVRVWTGDSAAESAESTIVYDAIAVLDLIRQLHGHCNAAVQRAEAETEAIPKSRRSKRKAEAA